MTQTVINLLYFVRHVHGLENINMLENDLNTFCLIQTNFKEFIQGTEYCSSDWRKHSQEQNKPLIYGSGTSEKGCFYATYRLCSFFL